MQAVTQHHASVQDMQHSLQATAGRQTATLPCIHQHMQHVLRATACRQTPPQLRSNSTSSMSCKQQQAGRHHTPASHQHKPHSLQANSMQASRLTPHHACQEHMQHYLQATAGRQTPHPCVPSAHAAHPAGSSRQAGQQPPCSPSAHGAHPAGNNRQANTTHAAHQQMQHNLQAMAGNGRHGCRLKTPLCSTSAHAARSAGNDRQAAPHNRQATVGRPQPTMHSSRHQHISMQE